MEEQQGQGFDITEYLKVQMKYLGFGEDKELHEQLEKGIAGEEEKFEIKTSFNRTSPGNEINYTLKFGKTETGNVFFNSYTAELTKENGDILSHSFKVDKNSVTAKEAINLLEGRAVKANLTNTKTQEVEPVFIKLKINEEKNDYGNFQMEFYNKNYGIDTKDIVEKSPIVFTASDNFSEDKIKEFAIKSLEKGNVVKVHFEMDESIKEGFAILNPQYKNLQLYDENMTRINTNKPIKGLKQDEHEKSLVREQSRSRNL